MSRKPAQFKDHPMSYTDARTLGFFRAYCAHVVDGDTIDVFVDFGMLHYGYETIRVQGINTPEIVGLERARGLECRSFVAGLVLNKHVLIQTYRDQMTFDRFVADVYYLTSSAWVSLKETLDLEGWGR